MNLSPLHDLAATWRKEADLLRRRGAVAQAALMESVAEDLVVFVRQWSLEELTLREAAAETGLSYHTIQKKVATNEIPNAGSKNAPRVRRYDLFPQPKATVPRTEVGEPDIATDILLKRLK